MPSLQEGISIRIGKSALTAIHQERTIDEHVSDNEYGSIIVVENVFHYKQLIALDLGDNYIGRYLKGTKSTNLSIPVTQASIHSIV